MIRILLNIGALAILLGLGVLIYRQIHAPNSELPVKELLEPQAPAPTPSSERRDLDHERETARQTTTPNTAGQNEIRPPSGDQPPAEIVELPAAPTPTPAPAESKPAVARTHQVRPGDSLWKISREAYGSTQHMQKIAEANKLGLNDMLRVGQVLVLPDIAGAKAAENAPVPVPNASPAPRDADHEVREAYAPEQPNAHAMPPTLSRPMRKP